MQTVDERHVVPDHIGQRREKVPGLHHHVDGLLGVAKHGDAGVTGHGFLPALKLARLAIRLHHRDDLLGHLLEVSHFVTAMGLDGGDPLELVHNGEVLQPVERPLVSFGLSGTVKLDLVATGSGV